MKTKIIYKKRPKTLAQLKKDLTKAFNAFIYQHLTLRKMENNIPWKFIGLGISAVLILLILIAYAPFTLVSTGNRGVVTVFGQVQDEILPEGFSWVSPTASVTEMSVQTQKFDATATAASSDLQSVNTEIVVNGHLDPAGVNKVYQEIGTDYENKVIDPAIQESVKAATAQFTAEELITKRAEVGTIIQKNLTDRLSPEHIIVESVSIVDFAFSPAFNEAVEAKVTAEQNALAAKNKLDQVQYEADQRVAEAKGEAEAIKIQAEAITSQGGADYVKLQWIQKWNGVLPTTTLGDAAQILLGL